jgi:hypothetical protein
MPAFTIFAGRDIVCVDYLRKDMSAVEKGRRGMEAISQRFGQIR